MQIEYVVNVIKSWDQLMCVHVAIRNLTYIELFHLILTTMTLKNILCPEPCHRSLDIVMAHMSIYGKYVTLHYCHQKLNSHKCPGKLQLIEQMNLDTNFSKQYVKNQNLYVHAVIDGYFVIVLWYMMGKSTIWITALYGKH